MENLNIWQQPIARERIKLALILLACLATSYGLYLLSLDEVATGVLWILGAAVMWMVGFFRTDWLRGSIVPTDLISNRLGWILFALIFIIGAFFRLYQLTEIPWGMSIDSSANTLKAFDILRGAPYEPLYLSRETMYFYFLAGFMKIFGYTSLAVRANSAFFGILALIPCYFFVRKLFNTQVALIATFILATSIYHITYSRSEWRCVQVPVFEFGAFYFLYQALHKGKWWYWTLTGILLGLGLNTYDSFRFVPIAIGLFLLLQFPGKRFLSNNWRGILILVIFSAIFFGPLGILAVTHWPEFAARASATSVVEKVQKAQSLQPLWDNIATTFLAPIYHAQGDFFDNQKPLFSPLESLLFLGGLSFLLANFRAKWAGFTLLAYLVTLIPAIVTFPNSQRLITAIPLTYVMGGLFLYALLQQFRKARLEWRWAPALPVYVLAALFCIAWSYTIYLGPSRRVTFGYEPERMMVAQYAKSIASTNEIIIDDRYNQGQVDFVNYIPGSDPYTHRFETFDIKRDLPIRRRIDQDLTIILEDLPHNRDLINSLKYFYPDLTTDSIPDHYNPTQSVAFAIHIPRQSLQSVHGYGAAYYSSPLPEAASLLSKQAESTLPPQQVPLGAKSVILDTWLWIDRLDRYTYLVPDGALSFEVDGQQAEIQNGRAAPILSQGFHNFRLTMTAGLSQMQLLTGDGQPVLLESSFNLQTPPSSWMIGLPTRVSTQSWQQVWRTGGHGADPNHFSRPMNLIVDSQGMIYVGDADNRRIVKLDSNGKTVATWAGWGTQPGYLEHEIGLTLLNDLLVVSDRWNNRIQAWDKSGQFKGVVVGPDQIGSPRAVTALPNGTFLVAAADEAKIRQFSITGQLLQNWGKQGTCPGCLIEPVGVAYDPIGYVYVTDGGRKTLQKFSPEGVFLNEWYISGITWESYVAVGPDNRVYITAPDENTIYTVAPEGSFLVYPTAAGDYQYFPGTFDHPMGVTLDNQGDLFITHTWSDEVVKYIPVPNPASNSAVPAPSQTVAPNVSPIQPTNSTLIYTGSIESKPATFFLGKVTVTNGQFTLRVTQIPGHAAVYDAIWFVDAAGTIYRFEAEDPQITRGDTFSSEYQLDTHWWLQPYSDFSNGYGLLAEKEETAAVLTSTVHLPDGDYQLYLNTFTGDPSSGPFMLGVNLSGEISGTTP